MEYLELQKLSSISRCQSVLIEGFHCIYIFPHRLCWFNDQAPAYLYSAREVDIEPCKNADGAGTSKDCKSLWQHLYV